MKDNGQKKFKGDDGEVKTLDNAGKVITEMTVSQEVTNASQLVRLLWGQGKENFIDLCDRFGDEEVMSIIEGAGISNLTDINDYLWFDIDNIVEMLGGSSDDEEEDEDN